jgi:hypothetical protein
MPTLVEAVSRLLARLRGLKGRRKEEAEKGEPVGGEAAVDAVAEVEAVAAILSGESEAKEGGKMLRLEGEMRALSGNIFSLVNHCEVPGLCAGPSCCRCSSRT